MKDPMRVKLTAEERGQDRRPGRVTNRQFGSSYECSGILGTHFGMDEDKLLTEMLAATAVSHVGPERLSIQPVVEAVLTVMVRGPAWMAHRMPDKLGLAPILHRIKAQT